MPLCINLSLVMTNPTGVSTYALSVLPGLRSLQPLILSPREVPGFDHYPVSADMTPEQGSRGHLRRLVWTQTQLPQIYRQQGRSLLFSPVPEMPLWQGCRTVVMVHDVIPLRFPRWRSPLTQYFRWVVPQVCRQALHIVCNSQATAQDVQAFFGIPEQKITPIPLAYDAQHFCPSGRAKRPYFLYLGRQDPYKNVGRVLQAFAQAQLPDYELWLAGGSDPRFAPGLAAQAVALGIQTQVKFLAYVPYAQLPQLLEEATALVFPSLWEGFGLPVLEAMACGTPVITSNCSALSEVAGSAAILVDPRQVGEIVAALRAIATTPQLQQSLQQAGLAHAKTFSWEQTSQQTAAVLERFL